MQHPIQKFVTKIISGPVSGKKSTNKLKKLHCNNTISKLDLVSGITLESNVLNEPKLKKKHTTNEVLSIAKEALGRGGGRACIATHGNGCRHYGILDLHPIDSKFYILHEEW